MVTRNSLASALASLFALLFRALIDIFNLQDLCPQHVYRQLNFCICHFGLAFWRLFPVQLWNPFYRLYVRDYLFKLLYEVEV